MKLRNLLAIMLVAVLATGVAMADKCGSKKSGCGKCARPKTEAVAKAKCSGECKEGKEKCTGGCDKSKAAAKKCCGTCAKAKAAKKSCGK